MTNLGFGLCLFVFAVWARAVFWLADHYDMTALGFLVVAVGSVVLAYVIRVES